MIHCTKVHSIKSVVCEAIFIRACVFVTNVDESKFPVGKFSFDKSIAAVSTCCISYPLLFEATVLAESSLF